MRTPLTITALCCLGCAGLGGGASVPIRDHLASLCPADTDLAGLELPRLDAPPSPLPEGPRVTLSPSGARVDGASATDLFESLQAASARADATAEASGEPPSLTVVLAADASVPVDDVIEALAAIREVGRTWVVLVADSDEAREVTPSPDPELAAKLQATLAPMDRAGRAAEMATQLAEALQWCPGAQRVFAAVAGSPPDVTCEIVAVGLDEALPSCPLTDADAVITLVQELIAPPSQLPTTLDLPLDADAEGEPMVFPAGTPWGEVLPALAAADPRPGRLAVE